MNLLTRSLSLVRSWLGLGEPSDDHLTPSHGWLLPDAKDTMPRREDGADPSPRVP
jgi:hypothetical protein